MDNTSAQFINYPIVYTQTQQVIVENKLQTPSDIGDGIDVADTGYISNNLPFNDKSTNSDGKSRNSSQSTQNYVDIQDSVVPPRAVAVLPEVLRIRRSGVISPRQALPSRVRFGPVEGIRNGVSKLTADELIFQASGNNVPIFFVKNNTDVLHIDVSDKDKSNWISLLPLGNAETANVWLLEENNALYAVTTESIPTRKPLKLGYSCKYAQSHGLAGPTKDIDAGTTDKQMTWLCDKCQHSMPSYNVLQKHKNLCGKKEIQNQKLKYKCRQCSKTFRRLFTLRRHIARHCPKNRDKIESTVSFDNETQDSINAILNSDENRIPSDESFQNFSNGLDFSTNLFDTDRMSSLDISSISRPDTDFVPYDMRYKDDNILAPDMDTSNNDFMPKEQLVQEKPKQVACNYCNQDILPDKKRKHVSECPARRFECECKKVFINKELLANHIIYEHHSNESEFDKDNKIPPDCATPDKLQFNCDQCQQTFKRRGMLVNHMWKVHDVKACTVPFERQIRYYPCVTCCKVYSTAAKRDRHVRLHHPGTEPRGGCVGGGRRAGAAAACAHCPRQYATRAKLLQHQRAHHPHLVPNAK